MRARQDQAGRRFGRITLDAPVTGRPGSWLGRCDCGNEVEKRLDNLKRPGDHSCGSCTAPTPRPPEGTARMALLEEEVTRLRRDFDRLSERLDRGVTSPPAATAITSNEGQAIWAYIDEMKSWLKREIGARLKALEQQVARVEPMERHLVALRGELADREEPAAAVRQELTIQQRQGLRCSPESATPARPTAPAEGSASSSVPPAPSREKGYPVRPAHPFHTHFHHWETPEGYELETNLAGTREFLGFHDTLGDVRHAVRAYLFERGYTDEALQGLFEDRESTVSPPRNRPRHTAALIGELRGVGFRGSR